MPIASRLDLFPVVLLMRPPPRLTLFPYTTLFRSRPASACAGTCEACSQSGTGSSSGSTEASFGPSSLGRRDRKSTRLNSSHSQTSYAVFCLKKKTNRLDLLPVALPQRSRPHLSVI